MKKIKYFFFVVFLAFSSKLLSQDQTILIFDPNAVSTSFQYTLSQLTEDSVYVADSLDDTIFNYNGLFLFVNYPYILSEVEENTLIQYTAERKPAYIFSNLLFQPPIDSTSLWHHIGFDEIQGLLIAVQVDSVTGIDTTFTHRVFIDTSFISWSVPVVTGNVDPILTAWWSGSHFNSTFISSYDSLNVILDLYNLIDDEGFLRRVLEYFELQPPDYVDEEIISLNEFVLSQNYPNPFNPVTNIQYAVSSRQIVTLKVYNVLGNEIATLVNEEKQPGTYEVEFNTSSIKHLPSSGVYFYQLKASNFVETKKMLLLK